MIEITGRSYRLKDVSIGGEDGKEEAPRRRKRHIRVGAIGENTLVNFCLDENMFFAKRRKTKMTM